MNELSNAPKAVPPSPTTANTIQVSPSEKGMDRTRPRALHVPPDWPIQ